MGAKAKASAQRIAEYQKGAVKRFLRVELTERLENAADNVFKAVAGKRNKIADNYLSLKAYAISAKDRVIDYRGKKKGSLSSVGDLLATLGALDSVKIRAAPGLGLGGGKAPPVRWQEDQGGQVPFQDQRSRERVHSLRRPGPHALASWSRQVPSRQA